MRLLAASFKFGMSGRWTSLSCHCYGQCFEPYELLGIESEHWLRSRSEHSSGKDSQCCDSETVVLFVRDIAFVVIAAAYQAVVLVFLTRIFFKLFTERIRCAFLVAASQLKLQDSNTAALALIFGVCFAENTFVLNTFPVHIESYCKVVDVKKSIEDANLPG
ncbi:unnamed protein product [Gongylonema pulchrum]|uniref:G_PROTEIN_RECEP_F1_2 domain-containing protein n=1 Tax=Gongylonema pulchrum TaxID=637853 RepID=A0A183D3T2_9BILA|nr:unnamed protein product [Gongylonema pulchrum]